MADRSRYRYVNFIGGRILQAREMDKLQDITRGVDDNNVPAAFDLDALFRDGATFNITLHVAGKTVTVTPTNAAKPMLVFVRGRWEILKPSEAPAVTLTTEQTNVYLNWQLNKITLVDDDQLKDITTGEATAEMGELRIRLSADDDSARAVGVQEFEKNKTPIVVFSFAHSSDPLIPVALDNAEPQALATQDRAGLVNLTTDTSEGKAAAADDARLSDPRVPAGGSVIDASVREPLQDGENVNADGTPRYDLNTDPGGIDSAKIIHQVGTQLASDAIELNKAKINAVEAELDSHVGATLGQGSTHPFPTPAQVGAAPASHVDKPLGVPGSHPALVSTSQGGFRVERDEAVEAAADDPAFGLLQGGTLLAALLHNGDLFAKIASTLIAAPLNEGGENLASGALDHYGKLAQVVMEHVNKKSHKNPHGLAPEDIGAATVTYVDGQDADTLAAAQIYTDAKNPGVSVSLVNVTNGKYIVIRFAPNAGNAIEIALGAGKGTGTFTIPLPTGFVAANAVATASIGNIRYGASEGGNELADIRMEITGLNVIAQHRNAGNSTMYSNGANWMCVAWRQGV